MADPDTIVALGTPPGTSALAVIRLSGPSAFSALLRLCPNLDGVPPAKHATLTKAQDPETGKVLDQVVVTAFRVREAIRGRIWSRFLPMVGGFPLL